MLITGEVIFPTETEAFSDAALIVELRDTRLADAPSRILERHVSKRISYDPSFKTNISFEIPCESLPEDYLPSVSVLIDLDRDERVGQGDFINTRSYYLQRNEKSLRIEVRRVK